MTTELGNLSSANGASLQLSDKSGQVAAQLLSGSMEEAKLTGQKEPELKVGDVLTIVYRALSEKGYNPVNQIVGYIMSGDPTYITSHNNARSLIMKVERDELVEEVLKAYIKNNHWE